MNSPTRVSHNRFHRVVWAFKNDFTGSLARWLVKQSPYVVPDKLSVCIEKFDKLIDSEFEFDINGMVEVNLIGLGEKLSLLLETIPEVMALNERKNGDTSPKFVSRYSNETDPDDDFIDIGAVARNIVCDFADAKDAQAYLDLNRDN